MGFVGGREIYGDGYWFTFADVNPHNGALRRTLREVDGDGADAAAYVDDARVGFDVGD